MNNAADITARTCFAGKNGGVVPEKVPSEAVIKEFAENPSAMHCNFGGIRFGLPAIVVPDHVASA